MSSGSRLFKINGPYFQSTLAQRLDFFIIAAFTDGQSGEHGRPAPFIDAPSSERLPITALIQWLIIFSLSTGSLTP
ncbi:MAG: hypothetical protein IPJ07_08295 [Acidobacteria bacterium]|nr:hypothetical protein [Acidobacteriota bacterium]